MKLLVRISKDVQKIQFNLSPSNDIIIKAYAYSAIVNKFSTFITNIYTIKLEIPACKNES